MTDPLDEIRTDVAELKRWAERHEEAHTADTRLLSSILDTMESHEGNHHGKASTIKNSGGVAAVLTLLYVAVELLRRFFL